METKKSYEENLHKELARLYEVAEKARKKGFDPELIVEMPLVTSMAQRVEGLISIVAPQIVGSGVKERIFELEKQYGSLDWRISLTIALEIAQMKFCPFETKLEAMIIGIRVGIAYITMGTVASPLEGFVNLQIRPRKDGKGEYFALYFSGPIRSAGGTGASVSVLIADYVRKKMGYAEYDPTENEQKRFVTELYDYHERITNLQYLPSPEEIGFLAAHIPVQIDGDPSEKIEVSNYKDLDRIETNRIRNGICLVMGEGIAQKAPKLWKQLSQWGEEFDLGHWKFLEEFLVLQKKMKAGKDKDEDFVGVKPDTTFIKDLVAGRPVLTHPLEMGGFRLRYGKSRVNGYSAVSLHPATMVVLDDYIAIGTQLKLERPGKAAVITSCDSIEGPIVKLKNGTVVKVDTEELAREVAPKVEEILFLGDMLVSYGDFFNRAHMLVPPGYCNEWWQREVDAAEKLKGGIISATPEHSRNKPVLGLREDPTIEEAMQLSKDLEVPLHPNYCYHWKALTLDQYSQLLNWLYKGKIIQEGGKRLVLPIDREKRSLELIGIPHTVENEFVVISPPHVDSLEAQGFVGELGLNIHKDTLAELREPLPAAIKGSPLKLRDKSGLFIGARMGRPEKAKIRKLKGSPQVLFPVGEAGGRMRSFQSALDKGSIHAEFPYYFCDTCKKDSIARVCVYCGEIATQRYFCRQCGSLEKEECEHGKAMTFKLQKVNLHEYFYACRKKMKMDNHSDLIKGVRGTSNRDHMPEYLSKGILRAKHQIYVNKDGTTRYDMTQVPITQFKPIEIGVGIEKLNELGYTVDVHGKSLVDENQVLELRSQDVILPACPESPDPGADEVLFNVANFMDDLLEKVYGLPHYYKLKKKEDLVGHLGMVIAPHTSAAIVCRIIGFSKTQGLFAHPMLHAATRRDCDGDESCVILLLDGLVNFSKHYLPAHRGSTQDAPLILTATVDPAEVDDMVFDLDVGWKYPLELYEQSLDYKNPWDVPISQVSQYLKEGKECWGFGYTHESGNLNSGVRCSAYKTLPSMKDKLDGQMVLAEKIRAVQTSDVADLVIGKHFMKDIKGNLRKFSTQNFRCVKCNEILRRPPLKGNCPNCYGRVIFTISQGSVVKYLTFSLDLVEKYGLSPYLKQTLELTKDRIESVFGKEKEKQEGLDKWTTSPEKTS